MYEDITQLRDEFVAYKEETQAKLLKLEEQRAQTENGTLVLSYPPTRQDKKVILEVAGGIAGAQTTYAGGVNSDGTANGLPSGWTSARLFAGVYQVTHNLGVANVAIGQSSSTGSPPIIANFASFNDDFTVQIQQGSSTVDSAFTFILVTK